MDRLASNISRAAGVNARPCRAPAWPVVYWMDSLDEDFCLCMCRQNVALSSAILFFVFRFGCLKPLIAALGDACQELGFALGFGLCQACSSLNEFGGVSVGTDVSVNVYPWSNRSGGASPSITQHSSSMRRLQRTDQMASDDGVVCSTDVPLAEHYNGVNPAP